MTPCTLSRDSHGSVCLWEDWPMRGLETDHGISGPMRGLKIISSGGDNTQHSDGHCNYWTDPALRAESLKSWTAKNYNFADRLPSTFLSNNLFLLLAIKVKLSMHKINMLSQLFVLMRSYWMCSRSWRRLMVLGFTKQFLPHRFYILEKVYFLNILPDYYIFPLN